MSSSKHNEPPLDENELVSWSWTFFDAQIMRKQCLFCVSYWPLVLSYLPPFSAALTVPEIEEFRKKLILAYGSAGLEIQDYVAASAEGLWCLAHAGNREASGYIKRQSRNGSLCFPQLSLPGTPPISQEGAWIHKRKARSHIWRPSLWPTLFSQVPSFSAAVLRSQHVNSLGRVWLRQYGGCLLSH